MSNELRYGVVGLGRAGWNIHVEALRKRQDSPVVAAADPSESRRQQAAAELGCRVYASLDELLTDAEVEIVVIATPSASHADDTIRTLRAGKHALVEKPMAMNTHEAQNMVDAAHAAGRELFIHHQWRFSREFTHLQDVIASGKLGRLFHIRNHVSRFERRNDWQSLIKNGGGELNNTCTHFLDQVMQLMGAPVVQVMGDLQRIATVGDAEDHVKALLRAANGVTADIEVTRAEALDPPLPRWILCGSCGTMTSDGKTSRIQYFDPAQVKPLAVVDAPADGRRYGNDDKLPWVVEIQASQGTDVGVFHDNVYDVIRSGQPKRVTPESIIQVMRVVEMIRQGTPFPGYHVPVESGAVEAAGRT